MTLVARAFLLAVLVAALGGCDTIGRWAGGPSETTVPDNLPSNVPAGPKVAVCYGSGTKSTAELAAAAAALCKEPGSAVEFVASDLNLNDCPLVKKRRAVYVCRPPR